MLEASHVQRDHPAGGAHDVILTHNRASRKSSAPHLPRATVGPAQGSGSSREKRQASQRGWRCKSPMGLVDIWAT